MNIKEEIINIKEQNLKTSWQKALFSTVVIGIVIYTCFAAYLFIKPISEDVEGIINTEINAADIQFNKKILDNLKKRQSPPDTTTPSTGKNPFLAF
jgi:hypothetical protein